MLCHHKLRLNMRLSCNGPEAITGAGSLDLEMLGNPKLIASKKKYAKINF